MKLLAVLRKDLQLLLRSRAEMAVLFLLPLAFIIPISFALGRGDGYGINRGNQMIVLPVANYDRGPRAQDFIGAAGESLRIEKEYDADTLRELGLSGDPTCAPGEAAPTQSPPATQEAYAAPKDEEPARGEAQKAGFEQAACVEKAARIMIERSRRPAVLVIPEGFSAAVDGGEQVEAVLLYDPAGDPARIQQIEGVLQGAAVKVSIQNRIGSGQSLLSDLAALAPEDVRQSIEAQTGSESASEDQQPAVRIEKVAPASFDRRQTPDTYQQTIPGYTVMYVFFIITSIAGSIRQEKLTGAFRRLLSAPVSRAELIGGKMLATILIGLAQVILLFLVGALLFGLGLGSSPIGFLLLTLALVTCAASIGLAASTTRISGGALTAPLIIAALLGGCMFPIDLMPPFLRAISLLTPHRWALQGYQNLIVRGQGLEEIIPQVGILLLFTLLFFLIAMRRLNADPEGGR